MKLPNKRKIDLEFIDSLWKWNYDYEILTDGELLLFFENLKDFIRYSVNNTQYQSVIFLIVGNLGLKDDFEIRLKVFEYYLRVIIKRSPHIYPNGEKMVSNIIDYLKYYDSVN